MLFLTNYVRYFVFALLSSSREVIAPCLCNYWRSFHHSDTWWRTHIIS